MHIRLFWKLFTVQMLAAAILLAATLLLVGWSTTIHFQRFLRVESRNDLRQDAARVAQAYQRVGDLRVAAHILMPRRLPPRIGRRAGGPPFVLRARRRRLPPPAPPWYQVQDPRHDVVGGDPRPIPVGRAVSVPIVANGTLVGYLAEPLHGPDASQKARAFLGRLKRVQWAIGGGAMALAALVAALIAALVLRPLRRLSGAVAALARRRFDTRIAVTSDDELGRLAADVNRLAGTLGEYDRRQKQWVADIAHELRTPLAVLRGELEALLDGVRPATGAAIRSLHQEVQRLGKLANDLHLLSVADSGALQMHIEDVALEPLIAEAVERFGELFARRSFVLEAQAVPPGLTVRADPARVDQVLANLLENALRHADPPGPVTISADRRGQWVCMRVDDAGPGVPPAALRKLFDRLYRVDDSRSRRNGGSGLGLAICRSLIEAQGGTIAADASARGGLEIEVRLPVGGAVRP